MSRILTLISPEGKTAKVQVLFDGGDSLAIATDWNWHEGKAAAGLYRIYLFRDGAAIGPHYASLSLAAAAMKKLRKAWPDELWIQPLEWICRQKKLAEWVWKEMGRPEDLVGGTWVDPDDWPPVQKRRKRGETQQGVDEAPAS